MNLRANLLLLAAAALTLACTHPTDPGTSTTTTLRLSNDATLSSLTTSTGSLYPAFDPSVTYYTLYGLDATVAEITLTGTAHDANASVAAPNGQPVALDYGIQDLVLSVTATDGSVVDYKVSVQRNAYYYFNLGDRGVDVTTSSLGGSSVYTVDMAHGTVPTTNDTGTWNPRIFQSSGTIRLGGVDNLSGQVDNYEFVTERGQVGWVPQDAPFGPSSNFAVSETGATFCGGMMVSDWMAQNHVQIPIRFYPTHDLTKPYYGFIQVSFVPADASNNYTATLTLESCGYCGKQGQGY